MFSPASRQISTSRVASATSLAPQALKKSVPPPNVPVPKLSTGTFKQSVPRCGIPCGIDAARSLGDAPERLENKKAALEAALTFANAEGPSWCNPCRRLHRRSPRSRGSRSFIQYPVVNREQRQLQPVRDANFVI